MAREQQGLLRAACCLMWAIVWASAELQSGPAEGGGVVIVSARPVQCQSQTSCIFGVGGGLHHAHALALAQGNGTNSSSSVLAQAHNNGSNWRCTAPAALYAGAAAILEPHEVMAGSQIFGGASIVDGEGGSGRIVRLTTTAQFTVVGTMVFAPPLAHTAPGAADFALDFELLCGRGTVGEGMSVSFAPLPNVPLHVDDMGMPQGLSISFRTGSSERVHIHFRGEQLLSARLDGGHVSQCDRYNCENCRDRLSCDLIDDVWCEWIPWQRVCRRPYFERQPPGGSPPDRHQFRSLGSTYTFVPVRVVVSGGRLTLTHGEHTYASHLLVPGWSELATSVPWRVVLGARTTIRVDDHWVRAFRMEQGATVGEAEVLVAAGGDDAACEQSYGYYSAPVVSRISLSHGPVRGGTRIHVFGSGFHRNQHRQAAMCRFGGVAVPAIRHNDILAVQCEAPASNRTGPVNVEVSLNGGADFSTTDTSSSDGGHVRWRTFTYTEASIARVEPPATSSGGEGPPLVLYGSGLSGGSKYRCRFGDVAGTVPAYLDTAHGGFVVCRAPSLPIENLTSPDAAGAINATLTLPVELSLNGVDYTRSNQTLTYVHPPQLHALSPSTGPSDGGTRVVIHGAFAPVNKWECRFGDGAIVPAARVNMSNSSNGAGVAIAPSASQGGGALVCQAPSMEATRAPPDGLMYANLTFAPTEQVRPLALSSALPLPRSPSSVSQTHPCVAALAVAVAPHSIVSPRHAKVHPTRRRPRLR